MPLAVDIGREAAESPEMTEHSAGGTEPSGPAGSCVPDQGIHQEGHAIAQRHLAPAAILALTPGICPEMPLSRSVPRFLCRGKVGAGEPKPLSASPSKGGQGSISQEASQGLCYSSHAPAKQPAPGLGPLSAGPTSVHPLRGTEHTPEGSVVHRRGIDGQAAACLRQLEGTGNITLSVGCLDPLHSIHSSVELS